MSRYHCPGHSDDQDNDESRFLSLPLSGPTPPFFFSRSSLSLFPAIRPSAWLLLLPCHAAAPRHVAAVGITGMSHKRRHYRDVT